jgi:hypothetical protein
VLGAAQGFARTGALDPKARYVRFNLLVTASSLARRVHRVAFTALAVQIAAVLVGPDPGVVRAWAGIVLGGLLAGLGLAVVGWRRAPAGAVTTMARVLRAEAGLRAWIAAALLADLAAAVAAVLLILERSTPGPGVAALTAGVLALTVAGVLLGRNRRRLEREQVALGGTPRRRRPRRRRGTRAS